MLIVVKIKKKKNYNNIESFYQLENVKNHYIKYILSKNLTQIVGIHLIPKFGDSIRIFIIVGSFMYCRLNLLALVFTSNQI